MADTKITGFADGTPLTSVDYLVIARAGSNYKIPLSTFRFADNLAILLGTGSDLELFHDGSNSYIQNNTGAIYIENDASDADIIFKINDGGVDTELMRLDASTSRVGIGTATPAVKLHVIGNILTQSNYTDTTNKSGYLGTGHYTNSEEPFYWLLAECTDTLTRISLGGGTSAGNAATSIRFITAANNTTVTGSVRATLDSNTLTLIGLADAVQLIVKGYSTQTSNLQTWQNSAGTVKAAIDNAGKMSLGGSINSAAQLAITPSWDGSASQYGLLCTTISTPASDSAFDVVGILVSGRKAGAYNLNAIYGIQCSARFTGSSGTVNTAYGALFSVLLAGANAETGTIVSARAISIATPTRTSGNLATITSNYGVYIAAQGTTFITNAYGIYLESVSAAATLNYAIYTNAGNILFNAGGDASTDFTVKSDAYDAIFVDASNNSIMVMSNAAGKVGFYGVTAVAQQVLATGAGNTADDIITFLQTIGLCKQS